MFILTRYIYVEKERWRSPTGIICYLYYWASYQILKIVGCACAGNAGNVSPRRRIQRKTRVSDPGMHHGTCVTHVPWWKRELTILASLSGLLTRGGGENVPGIPGACEPAIWRIWQEAHCQTRQSLNSHDAFLLSVMQTRLKCGADPGNDRTLGSAYNFQQFQENIFPWHVNYLLS